MARQYRRWLMALVLVSGVIVIGLMVIEPFLNLPPFWEQLDVGIALTGYGGLMLLGIVVFNRKLWPKKWRLNRTPPAHLQFIKRFVASVWGIDDSGKSGK